MPLLRVTEKALPSSTVQIMITKKMKVSDMVKDNFIVILFNSSKENKVGCYLSSKLDLCSSSDLLVCSQSIYPRCLACSVTKVVPDCLSSVNKCLLLCKNCLVVLFQVSLEQND